MEKQELNLEQRSGGAACFFQKRMSACAPGCMTHFTQRIKRQRRKGVFILPTAVHPLGSSSVAHFKVRNTVWQKKLSRIDETASFFLPNDRSPHHGHRSFPCK
jgi:hypothetical protein